MNVTILDAENSIIKSKIAQRERSEIFYDQQVSPQTTTELIIDDYVTVQAATEISGYNGQYLRRLLRAGKLDGLKVGQVWLIDLVSLQTYFSSAISSNDLRCGPKGAWQAPF